MDQISVGYVPTARPNIEQKLAYENIYKVATQAAESCTFPMECPYENICNIAIYTDTGQYITVIMVLHDR